MGYQLSFDSAHKILLISFDGVLTDNIWAGPHAALMSSNVDAAFCLIDYTRVTEAELSVGALRAIGYKSISNRECPRVFIAPQDIMFGYSRMFKVFSEDSRPRVHVVRTMEEALEWIGVKSPSFFRIDVDPAKSA